MRTAFVRPRTDGARVIDLLLVLVTLTAAPPVQGQARQGAGAAPPRISARTFIEGSAKVKVTGAIQIDADIAIDKQASIADGEMSWIQYGPSGGKDPNATITVSEQEVGVNAGQGNRHFTAGPDQCTGRIEVNATLVKGEYTCKGVTSYDMSTRQMSKVDVTITFSAHSEHKR